MLQYKHLMNGDDIMTLVWILLGVLALLATASVVAAYICYRIAFYAPPRTEVPSDKIEIPEGDVYEAFRDFIEARIKEVRAMPYEEFSVTAFDGLTLYGKYFEYRPGAPIELMFHGYRGNAERDLAGGVQRCFQVGRSVLLVDQRCAGKSEGSTITFGVNEHRDCLSWLDFMLRHFGPDVKIILTGVSMGAATVLIAGSKALPPNVMGILADCSFSSPRDIMAKEIQKMGIPAKLGYPFVKLGARLFGHFDLEEITPMEAVKKCTLPVIFYHGEADDFVPCDMSVRLHEACVSRKQLVTIPGAGHGLSYPVAQKYYLTTLREFFGPEASWQE